MNTFSIYTNGFNFDHNRHNKSFLAFSVKYLESYEINTKKYIFKL
jgi:hypothetical protein